MSPDHLRNKVVINSKVIEEVYSFTYLRCVVCWAYIQSNDVGIKLYKFQKLVYTLRGNLKVSADEVLQFYKAQVRPVLLHGFVAYWTLISQLYMRNTAYWIRGSYDDRHGVEWSGIVCSGHRSL